MTPEEQRNQKDLILGHAEELMRRVGYKAFSYQDLADRLGVSKPAIHHHFATKDTLGLALIQLYDAHFSSLVGQVEAEGRSAGEQVFAFLWLDGGPTTGCDICPLGALQMHFETFSSAMQRATVELSQRMHGWLAEKFSEARTEGEVQSWGTPEQQAVFLMASMQGGRQQTRALGAEALVDVRRSLERALFVDPTSLRKRQRREHHSTKKGTAK